MVKSTSTKFNKSGIHHEFTGTKSHRPELDKLLAVMQPGDTLKVTKLDRIARSATQGIELIQSLLDKGITVHVLKWI